MKLGSLMAWTMMFAIGAGACVVEDGGDDDDGNSGGSEDTTSSGQGAAASDGPSATTGESGTGAQDGSGGSGQGASGQGGSVSSGDPQACGLCIEEVTGLGGDCHELDEQCADDDICDGWRACIEACGFDFEASCFAGCDELYAPAAVLWAPLKECTCSVCGTECAPGCP